MKRPTYRIATLLLFVGMFALGWRFGVFTTRSAELTLAERTRTDEQVDYVLASAVWINKMIEIANEPPAERDTRFRNHLILQIYDLARTEKFQTGNNDGVFLMHGSHSLQHLGVSNYAELESAVRDARLVASAKEPFLDETNEDYDEIVDFVTRSIAYDPNAITSP
ncbi:hypothetical protein CA13_09820 [Planctomycetes bacterium CA13]|uniref:Uncharacterized protein n=1 Tax=Novipirellula herctigrandis TaxID=2527986 RepID=A0A5C5YX09_9BACT|nr:hypothetical protein CA13_09820 [Planctomycetes bacterium CA13]